MTSPQRPLYPGAHLDRLLRRLRGLDIEEEGLPSHVKRGRLRVVRAACSKLLHGVFEVPLTDEAPGAHVVADNLNARSMGSDETNKLTAATQQVVTTAYR